MSIHRTVAIDVAPTPEELADAFASMDDEGQARFFNELAVIVGKWEHPFCFQLQYVTDNPGLTKEAREVMSDIGDYAQRVE